MVADLRDEEGRGDEEDLKGDEVEDIDDRKDSQHEQPYSRWYLFYPVMMFIRRVNMKIPFTFAMWNI